MIRRVAAIYSIVVGASMLGMWGLFYSVGTIPELATQPVRIMFHIVAECFTAAALIVAGVGLVRGRSWGGRLYLLATGALLYTVIQSPGYFWQQGDYGFIVMFAVLLLVGIVLLVGMTKQMARSKRCSS